MKEHFEKIRNIQKELSSGKGSWAKTIGAEFFKDAPWFLKEKVAIRPLEVSSKTQLDIAEAQKSVPDVLDKEIVKESVSKSEKEQTIKSLEKFAQEKTSEVKTSKFKFDGGEINVKETMAHVIDCVAPKDANDYLSQKYSESTTVSFVKGGESIDVEKGIKVLFVGEKKIEDLEEFDEGIHWNSELSDEDLLGKMIKAMKLESGEFVRTILIGDNENALENICLEIEALKPQVIISLGALATNILLGKKEKLSQVHGEFFTRSYKFRDGKESLFKLVPVFHPDFLEITPTMKRTAWMDLQKVMEFLDENP